MDTSLTLRYMITRNTQIYVISQSAMEGLIQLVKVDVRPQNLPEFFWRHLEQDIELLEKAMGKSMDDSAIIVHLVLKEILLKDPPKCEDYG